MFRYLLKVRESLIAKIIVATCAIMFVGTLILVYLSISFVNTHTLSERVKVADMMGNTIKVGLYSAMLRNSRDEIDQIIRQVADMNPVSAIRLYNKEGEIKFSSDPGEKDDRINLEHYACRVCHLTDPPKESLPLEERIWDFHEGGQHFFSVQVPIGNPPECSGGPCHYHPAGKNILGTMDLIFTFEEANPVVADYQTQLVILGFIFFVITSCGIYIGFRQIISRPLGILARSSREIAEGQESSPVWPVDQRRDEFGQLARAHQAMVEALQAKQKALNAKVRDYELLFDNVPCVVTVQDREFKLLEYNKESRERFNPFPDAYCYQAYKGVDEMCEVCPVDKTFETGLAHCSEESRRNPDGSYSHWIVHTAPIMDENGEVTKAMEMCLDITERRNLEIQLRESEEKYHAIFNNAPTSFFVLDFTTLVIRDYNDTTCAVFGYEPEELIGKPFMQVIHPDEMDRLNSQMRTFTAVNQVKCLRKGGEDFFVDMMFALSRHTDKEYLLVSATDITERLEAEQLLFHAGKMATLGEMATGVAHELNQPLTVIKTASNFFMKKVAAKEDIPRETLATMAREVDSYVDRATKIITHMREFGRKGEQHMEAVMLNDCVERAFTLLNKQFTARGIVTRWELEDDMPPVFAIPDQLEQVIINLLVNARDVLEEKTERGESDTPRITVKTYSHDDDVIVEIEDNGGGIEPTLIHKIFEPFFTTKKVGKGTGLGLSISYGLIKDFGGSIEADNGKHGARFTIRLPIADN